MQAAVQAGLRLQRVLTSPQHSKTEPVNANQGKGKKRERTDQSQDSSKREKSMKQDDCEPGLSRQEGNMNFEEIASIATKDGGLANIPCVDQLVQVMLEERYDTTNASVDVASRRMLLASIVAATEKDDCLTRFVQLGGLPVLDDWLQEAHKGKVGDCGSPKEGDKGVEDLLLTLLRALDKLPVDLDALKTCIVGKSVNNLRSHRNQEIQKKARKLVETWKKRVDAEMKSSDESKSTAATWSGKQPTSEIQGTKVRCVVDRSTSRSNTGARPVANGPCSGDATNSPCGGGCKDHTVKESHCSGTTETVKEEKSCSSSQSQSNSHSGGSGSGKGKEEFKMTSATSTASKNFASTLRSRSQPSKGMSTASSKDLHKDTASGKHKTLGTERVTGSSLMEKGKTESSHAENFNNHRIIVRIPNPARSPAYSFSGGALADAGDPSSRTSSPGSLARDDLGKTTFLHSPDSSGGSKNSNLNRTVKSATPESRGVKEMSLSASADDLDHKSSDTELKAKDSRQGSSSSRLTGAFGTLEGQCLDAIKGMALLANAVAHTGPETHENGMETASESKPLVDNNHKDCSKGAECSNGTEVKNKFCTENGHKEEGVKSIRFDEPKATEGLCSSDTSASQERLQYDLKAYPVQSAAEQFPDSTVSVDSTGRKMGTVSKELDECHMETVDSKAESILPPSEVVICNVTSTAELLTDQTSSQDNTGSLDEASEDGKKVSSSSPTSPVRTPLDGDVEKTGDLALGYDMEDALEVARQVAKEVEQEVELYSKPDVPDVNSSNPCKSESTRMEDSKHVLSSISDACDSDKHLEQGKGSTDAVSGFESGKEIHVTKEVVRAEQTAAHERASCCLNGGQNLGQGLDEKKESEEPEHTCHLPPSAEESEVSSASLGKSTDDVFKGGKCGDSSAHERPVFDLNEGLDSEEAFYDSASQPTNPAASQPDNMSVGASPTSLAAPVAVVAATKGAFIPPSNTLRSNGEAGWKGSAATSAFRPAEPRRIAESFQSLSDSTVSQSGRRMRVLDIDLNVADDRTGDDTDMASSLVSQDNSYVPHSGGSNERSSDSALINSSHLAPRIELDLNRAGESEESVGPMVLDSSNLPGKGLSGKRVIRDFDLNNGLCVEDSVVEESPQRSSIRTLENSVLHRPGPELANAPWYSTPNAVPAVMMPSFTAGRPESSYPLVASSNVKATGPLGHNIGPFTGDPYRSGALVSSSNVPFSANVASPMGYAALPFGLGFPFTSATYNISSLPHTGASNTPPFPAVPSQLVSAGAVVPPYGRSYVVGISDLPGGDTSVSWSRPSLDLNAGPDIVDIEGRDDGPGSLHIPTLNQLPFQQGSGLLKRKEPECGFDPFRSGYRQMTWR